MAKASILTDLINYLNIPVSTFERSINVGPSTIAKAIGRNSVIKMDTIVKIRSIYPQVSESWLQSGRGEMIANTVPQDLILQGARLKHVRELLGMSQDDFGKVLGGEGKPVDKATVSKYENGLLSLSARARLELHTALDVNKDWLENGDGYLPFNASVKVPVNDEEDFTTLINTVYNEIADVHQSLAIISRAMSKIHHLIARKKGDLKSEGS